MPADGDYACHFTGKKPSNSFYTITGNYSDSKGQATVGGTTYTDCLKIESKTSITFTIAQPMTLTLVFAEGTVPDIKIDGVKVTAESGNIITYELEAGAHEITKASTFNLFYINLTAINDSEGAESINRPARTTDETDAPYYDLSGHRMKYPVKGKIYIREGKKVVF